jgi:ABC-2 type transport system permease protein/sodium transport system permease protein
VINAALLIVLFLIAPAVYVWYRRLRFRETFLLTFMGSAPSGGWQGALRLTGVVAAVVLMASGLWIVAYEALKTLSDLGFGTIDLERIAGLEEAKAKFRAVPLWLLLATSALAPAVAEEFFFRGFVLSALRSRLSGVRAVVYSAILFGLFHVVNGSVLSIERFVPTALLGLALGVLAVRTDTLWPGILLHAIHNGLLFWLTRFNQAELAQWFGSEQEHFPVPWVVGSLLSIGIGIAILFASTLKRSDEITA